VLDACDMIFFAQSAHWSGEGRLQGRNEVRWCPGQEAGLAPPCSNLRSFLRQGSNCGSAWHEAARIKR